MRLVIVGGGMAGLCAAISAAEAMHMQDNRKGEILLLDAGKEPGHKILATGNGRCNLTNRRQDKAFYRTGEQGADFLFHPDGWDLEMTEFMESLGILLHERDGYVYPRCDQAAAVREALLRRIQKENVTVLRECRVREIRRKASGGFQVSWSRGKENCSSPADVVILSTGGMVSGAYHCMGDGYRLARELGHHVTEPVPALCALFTDDPNRCRCKDGLRRPASDRWRKSGRGLRRNSDDCRWNQRNPGFSDFAFCCTQPEGYAGEGNHGRSGFSSGAVGRGMEEGKEETASSDVGTGHPRGFLPWTGTG